MFGCHWGLNPGHLLSVFFKKACERERIHLMNFYSNCYISLLKPPTSQTTHQVQGEETSGA